MKSRLTLAILIAASALGLSACTVTPARVSFYGPPVVDYYDPYPPARVEIIAAPVPRHYLWGPGDWRRGPPPHHWREESRRGRWH